MPVRARQHIRRMRGGANAQLLLADDDQYYVVKFRNNPQHARILVNELICYVLLDYLQLPTPGWDLVEVKPQLVAESPAMTMECGRELRRCEPGMHFGSRFPVDPSRQAVYDYVPLALLRLVVNRNAFLGMAAFDKWIGNADGRQAVYFRDRAGRWLPPDVELGPDGRALGPRSLVYVVNMIDHGFAFNAHHWEFADSAEIGLYSRREVYADVQGYDSFEPWLSRILEIPTAVFDDAYKRIPSRWHGGDWDQLEALLETLYNRRKLVPELLRRSKEAERDPFPAWHDVSVVGGAR